MMRWCTRLAPTVAIVFGLQSIMSCVGGESWEEVQLSASELQAMSASEFLELLKQRPTGTVVVPSQVEGWPSLRDAGFLSSVLDDSTPCQSIRVPISSHLLPGESTVGDEAGLLILAIKVGSYPPDLNSRRFTPGEKSELKAFVAGRYCDRLSE
jgi:hypothetical protein